MSINSDSSSILSELTQIARNVFDDPSLELTPSTTANEVEQWDSINHIQFIVAVEKKYGIRFKVADITDLKNVGEFVAAIQRYLNTK
jgi:acyl carrier protein